MSHNMLIDVIDEKQQGGALFDEMMPTVFHPSWGHCSLLPVFQIKPLRGWRHSCWDSVSPVSSLSLFLRLDLMISTQNLCVKLSQQVAL